MVEENCSALHVTTYSLRVTVPAMGSGCCWPVTETSLLFTPAGVVSSEKGGEGEIKLLMNLKLYRSSVLPLDGFKLVLWLKPSESTE